MREYSVSVNVSAIDYLLACMTNSNSNLVKQRTIHITFKSHHHPRNMGIPTHLSLPSIKRLNETSHHLLIQMQLQPWFYSNLNLNLNWRTRCSFVRLLDLWDQCSSLAAYFVMMLASSFSFGKHFAFFVTSGLLWIFCISLFVCRVLCVIPEKKILLGSSCTLAPYKWLKLLAPCCTCWSLAARCIRIPASVKQTRSLLTLININNSVGL